MPVFLTTSTFQSLVIGNYLKAIMGKYCLFINLRTSLIEMAITSTELVNPVLTVLKKDPILSFEVLSDIAVVDYVGEKKRFQINYILFSYKYSTRLKLTLSASTLTSLQSSTSVYSNANWLERQAWDMFGIYFENHPDLRRILTDYGFQGFPLRKDFPLLGYFEVYYDDEMKRVSYKPVKLTQAFRDFNFKMAWKEVR
jgi:NADH/F420H2 dehydrogenase subunit C